MLVKEAKELGEQGLGVGIFTENDPWISSEKMFTSNIIKIGTKKSRIIGSSAAKFYIETYDSTNMDNVILQREDKSGENKNYSVISDSNGNLICIALRTTEFLHASNCIYYYRTKPSFEGQDPSSETVASIRGNIDIRNSSTWFSSSSSESEKDAPTRPYYDNEPLYVWARLITITTDGDDDFARRSLISFCKGFDTECETGYAWKPLYKAIQVPQFQYKAVVIDMQGNIVCKSKQKGTIDNSGMYEIAPNSDITLVLLACQCLTPDGTKLLEGLDIATEIVLASVGI